MFRLQYNSTGSSTDLGLRIVFFFYAIISTINTNGYDSESKIARTSRVQQKYFIGRLELLYAFVVRLFQKKIYKETREVDHDNNDNNLKE